MSAMPQEPVKPPEELQQLVAESDTGGRKVAGPVGQLIFWVAVGWSLFQLWYASPLPFTFGIGILNDTEARSLHLGVALFLAFLCYPAFKRSSRKSVAWYDWILAVVGAFAGAYFLLFYGELATRPGQPNQQEHQPHGRDDPASPTCRTSSSRPWGWCSCWRRRGGPSACR